MKSSATTTEGIRRSAARLRWAVFGAMAAMLLLYAAARFGFESGAVHVQYRPRGPDALSAHVIGDVTVVLLLVALFRLTQMLARIADGELFTAAVIARFRSFALWLLVMALFALLAPSAAALLRLAAGGHGLELMVSFREVLTVGVTLVLFLLARLLERARAIEDEMREIV